MMTFQVSGSWRKTPAGGISVPGTPRRTRRNSPSSVAPVEKTLVRLGPRAPRASIPWQYAQFARKAAIPSWMTSGVGWNGFLSGWS